MNSDLPFWLLDHIAVLNKSEIWPLNSYNREKKITIFQGVVLLFYNTFNAPIFFLHPLHCPVYTLECTHHHLEITNVEIRTNSLSRLKLTQTKILKSVFILLFLFHSIPEASEGSNFQIYQSPASLTILERTGLIILVSHLYH